MTRVGSTAPSTTTGGKLHVDEQMTNFADFLRRLKELNPGLDLSNFPAEPWPGFGTPPAERNDTGPIRRVLLPLVFVALFFYLTSETLRG